MQMHTKNEYFRHESKKRGLLRKKQEPSKKCFIFFCFQTSLFYTFILFSERSQIIFSIKYNSSRSDAT